MKTFLSILVVVMLAGCASYVDLGNGHYAKTALSEKRSPFGTNSGFMRLESCKGEKPGVFENRPATDCQALTDWVPVSSQGQGGQVAMGALIGAGAGLGAAYGGSQVIQNATTSIRASTINPK